MRDEQFLLTKGNNFLPLHSLLRRAFTSCLLLLRLVLRLVLLFLLFLLTVVAEEVPVRHRRHGLCRNALHQAAAR